jgi:glutamine synthetase
VFSITDISGQKEQQQLLKNKSEALQELIERMKKLEGIISICMFCKKIRNKNQDWEQLEKYISEHSDACFSHGICPECLEKNYPEVKS